jgi:hypothetical protein
VKIADEEVMRAHKLHTALQTKVDDDALVLAEDIDRAVRSCMQQSSLKSEESPAQKSKRVSYEEWHRRKALEAKLRKRLAEEADIEEQERQHAAAEEQRMRQEYNQHSYHNWLEEKRREEEDQKQRKMMGKYQKEQFEKGRKEEAEVHYKEWLRDNYIKLQQTKQLEREQELRNRHRAKEEALQAAERRRHAEATFYAWVNSKRRSVYSNSQRRTPREEHKAPHLPFLLAYSPNRRRVETPSEVDITEYEESDSSPPKRKLLRTDERRHTEVSQFDEISSIRRNPMLFEQMHSIDGTESILEDEDIEEETEEDSEGEYDFEGEDYESEDYNSV